MKPYFLLAVVLCGIGLASAQKMPPIPVDKQVRIGHLDNGLTYYLRHNEEPQGQANFYIAQKVGSILEEENQRGLAHFLEHMCFNGTEHFPGNGVVKYCESIGVQFGGDLNAYTGVDETVYNIDNVPIAKVPSAVDSCLWILHDWADGLLLEGEDIDKERGVIHEEWRSRQTAMMRMYHQLLPEAYPGNRYGERLPIGLMSVVDSFPYQALRDYYEKWYRPDQQGIVVVGDFDVDWMEGKIKDIFGTIQAPENPAERFYVPVEDNAGPLVAVATDKEQPYAFTYLYFKRDAATAEEKSSMEYLVVDYVTDMIDAMFCQRLSELAQKPEPPFIEAVVQNDMYLISKTKDALAAVAVYDPSQMEQAVSTLYREVLRAVRHGFTEGEYDRARAEYLNNLESAYNQRAKTKSETYCKQYVRHFIDNEPIPGIETMYQLMPRLAPAIPLKAVNECLAELVTDSNLVVCHMLPELDGVTYPEKDAQLALLAQVAAEDIAPYEDTASDQPLMATLPKAQKPGKLQAGPLGYQKMTLKNGVTVYIKPTDFNQDEILMTAFSLGGLSLYGADGMASLQAVDDLTDIGGLGNFSATDLDKALAGKKVSFSAHIGNYSESVSASTTPKDFETMLQLTTLGFTAIRQDDDAFQSWQNRTRSILLNQEADPMSALQDTLTQALYGGNLWARPFKAADVDSVDYARALAVCRERFANAADFTFVFTGNINTKKMLPLIARYLGNLPASASREQYNDIQLDFTLGQADHVFVRPMEVPMATVVYVHSARLPYSQKERLTASVAGQVLDIVMTEEIREKEGGTYGVSVGLETVALPYEEAYLQLVYQTDPDRYEYLNSRIEAIVAQMAQDGPREADLAKVKDYMAKNHQENLRENKYFSASMSEYLKTGLDVVSDYESVLESITADDVRGFLTDLLGQHNCQKVVMSGTAE